MKRYLLALTVTAGAVLAMPTDSFAQTSGKNCKAEISATGSAALTKPGAEEKAKTQWRRTVIARYGDFYGQFDQAKSTTERCTKTLLGLTRCEVRGQPCEATTVSVISGTAVVNELECNPSTDSKKCIPVVKWVQTQLNAKIGANLKADGAAGRETEAAIRRFKKQSNLLNHGNSEINDALINALKT
jgi:hypothetical protein